MMELTKAGLIGLGNMGMTMAKSLVKSGLSVTVFDTRKERLEEMRLMGASIAKSCGALAMENNIVISIVNDIADTDEVMFGNDGVWQSMKAGGIVIIASTVGPEYCRKVYSKAKERNIRVIDAAVSKSGPSNVQGELTLMVGGDRDAVDRCQPVFKALAKHIFHVGNIGMGQSYKLVNNLLSLGLAVVTRETLNLGLKAGLDFNTMLDVMQYSTGNNWNLQYLRYLLNSRELDTPSNAPTKNIGTKDWKLALDFAKQANTKVPVTEFIHDLDTRTIYDAFDKVMQDKRL